MAWEMIIIGAFVLLAIGRMVWEKRTKAPSQTESAQIDAEWFRAIK